MHIHIEKAEKYAKFWIEPLCVVVNFGFSGKELREIAEIIEKNETLLRDKWNEYFGS